MCTSTSQRRLPGPRWRSFGAEVSDPVPVVAQDLGAEQDATHEFENLMANEDLNQCWAAMELVVNDLRNLAAHPGRYIRERVTPDLFRPGYGAAYGILRAAFDATYGSLEARTSYPSRDDLSDRS